jgi:hypothetical protein
MAQIKADEITATSSRADRELRLQGPGRRSRDHHIARRRHCPPARARQGDGRRAAQLSARHRRTGPEPGRGFGRRSVILGDYTELSEGDEVKRTGTILSVPVGEGHDRPRGQRAWASPSTTRAPSLPLQSLPIERLAPGIIDRQPVREPMATGLKAIDAMIPIGRGQRELIIGDRQTGKTAVLLDTIINNAKNDLICIYCAIGQKRSSIAQVVQTLTEAGAMGHTVIVAASASEPAPMLYIAPYAATAIGEFFRDSGRHALVMYDDLSKHAMAYREISLLLRRPPGREAYPGDVFYLHSRLLGALLQDVQGERAAARSPRCRSSRPRPATSPPTFPPTSSPSPTARSSLKPISSTPAFVRR